jgi:hypothetical protein
VSAPGAYVGNTAFNNCSSLTHVELPNNLTTATGQSTCSIRFNVFKGTNLLVLILRADDAGIDVPYMNPSNSSYAFPNPDTGFSIYVPDARVSDYKSHWGYIRDKIKSINDLPLQDNPSNWN